MLETGYARQRAEERNFTKEEVGGVVLKRPGWRKREEGWSDCCGANLARGNQRGGPSVFPLALTDDRLFFFFWVCTKKIFFFLRGWKRDLGFPHFRGHTANELRAFGLFTSVAFFTMKYRERFSQ